jgi:hypothetical protein
MSRAGRASHKELGALGMEVELIDAISWHWSFNINSSLFYAYFNRL